jgi:zinc protease
MNVAKHGASCCSSAIHLILALGLAAAPWTVSGASASPSNASRNAVLRATLKNGLRVIIVRNRLAPVVTTVINYRVGSDETPPGFPGTAHALEHMMFRGSPGLSASQLADIAAAMGGDFNADTQQGLTQYFFTVPAENMDVALHIEAQRMKGLRATRALWAKERGAIEQEVAQDLSNPEYVFYTQLLRAMFDGTPYAHDALGTRPSFDKTTAAALRRFHRTWYGPNNAILIIVGDVQPENALREVRRLFGAIRERKLPPRPAYTFAPVKPKMLHLDTDLPYGMAVITFRLPGSDSADYAACQVLSDVLSSQRGKLYELVPDGKALFAEFAYESLPKAGMGYAIAGFPAGADALGLLQQVKQILAAETAHGVLEDLVTAAKRREVADAEFQKNSVSGLAMAWSQAVAGEGRQSPQDDVDAIRRVTAGDVNRVARQYLSLDHAISAILKPQPSGKPISSKGFGGQESFAPSKAKGVKLPRWAAQAIARAEVPSPTLKPVVTTLKNGLKLIVQPESISDTVSVFGQVKNNPNVETPKGREGVDRALDQLFSFGTRTLDRVAFQKALDDIGANESAGTTFSVQVLAGDFDRGVQLLADNELSPALPEHAFTVIQPQLASSVAGELQSPGYLAGRAVRAALFPPHDPVQRQTTPKTVKALSIQDVRHYYRHVFRPDLTTIVVIGNITPGHARSAIQKYFGNWAAVGPQPDTLFPPAPNNASSSTHVPDSSRVQDRVTLAETLAITRTNEDYYALELGNHVLGGGFYATRLYRDLREKSGLTYYVGSSFQIGETRGIYQVEYACDPPNVSKARAIVVNDLKAMQTSDVTPDELRQARALLLREIPLAESSVRSIAMGWLSRSLHHLPLDEPIRAARRYVKLTAPEIRAAFAKWLRLDDLVQVVQGPAPH